MSVLTDAAVGRMRCFLRALKAGKAPALFQVDLSGMGEDEAWAFVARVQALRQRLDEEAA